MGLWNFGLGLVKGKSHDAKASWNLKGGGTNHRNRALVDELVCCGKREFMRHPAVVPDPNHVVEGGLFALRTNPPVSEKARG